MDKAVVEYRRRRRGRMDEREEREDYGVKGMKWGHHKATVSGEENAAFGLRSMGGAGKMQIPGLYIAEYKEATGRLPTLDEFKEARAKNGLKEPSEREIKDFNSYMKLEDTLQKKARSEQSAVSKAVKGGHKTYGVTDFGNIGGIRDYIKSYVADKGKYPSETDFKQAYRTVMGKSPSAGDVKEFGWGLSDKKYEDSPARKKEKAEIERISKFPEAEKKNYIEKVARSLATEEQEWKRHHNPGTHISFYD